MIKQNTVKISLVSAALSALVACGGGNNNNVEANKPENRVLFLNNGVNGTEPWITDGTEKGTKLLKDINTTGDSVFRYRHSQAPLGNKTIFTAFDGNIDAGKNGTQLWMTDGTEAGTRLIKTFSSNVRLIDGSYSQYKNKVFFSMNVVGENKGYELWSTDGTAEGTSMVKDICDGACSAYPSDMTEYKDKLYFRAYTGTHGSELWVTDGTENGTTLFKDFAPRRTINGVSYRGNGLPKDLAVSNGKLFISANNNSMSDSYRQLWVSDGTTEGTQLFKDLLPHTDLPARPNKLFSAGSTLYFKARIEGSTLDYLYTSDGTPEGTKLFKDAEGGTIHIGAHTKTVSNGIVYFSNGNVFKTDGTKDGTAYLTNNLKNASTSVVLGDSLYVIATNDTYGREVYYLSLSESDYPVAASVIDINKQQEANAPIKAAAATGTTTTDTATTEATPTKWSNPQDIFVLNGNVYVMANDGVHGYEIWVIDPKTKEAKLLKDVNSTSDGASSFSFGNA